MNELSDLLTRNSATIISIVDILVQNNLTTWDDFNKKVLLNESRIDQAVAEARDEKAKDDK